MIFMNFILTNYRYKIGRCSTRSAQSLGPLFKPQYGRNWRTMGAGMDYFGERTEEEWNPVDNPIPDIHRGNLSPQQWQFIYNKSSSERTTINSENTRNQDDFLPEHNDSGEICNHTICLECV